VERVGEHAKADRSRVGLALREQVASDLRRLAETERQETAGEGIEGAEVTDLGPAEARLERADGAGRRRALRLVDEQEAGHRFSSSDSAAVPWRSSSSTRRA